MHVHTYNSLFFQNRSKWSLFVRNLHPNIVDNNHPWMNIVVILTRYLWINTPYHGLILFQLVGKKKKKNCDETGENALTKIGRSSTGYYQLWGYALSCRGFYLRAGPNKIIRGMKCTQKKKNYEITNLWSVLKKKKWPLLYDWLVGGKFFLHQIVERFVEAPFVYLRIGSIIAYQHRIA